MNLFIKVLRECAFSGIRRLRISSAALNTVLEHPVHLVPEETQWREKWEIQEI